MYRSRLALPRICWSLPPGCTQSARTGYRYAPRSQAPVAGGGHPQAIPRYRTSHRNEHQSSLARASSSFVASMLRLPAVWQAMAGACCRRHSPLGLAVAAIQVHWQLRLHGAPITIAQSWNIEIAILGNYLDSRLLEAPPTGAAAHKCCNPSDLRPCIASSTRVMFRQNVLIFRLLLKITVSEAS